MSSTITRTQPFPLHNPSDHVEPVTLVTLSDTTLPRLKRAHCELRGLSHATAAREWRIIADLGSALAALEDDIAKCRDQIARAPQDAPRDAVLPKLCSAHCLLYSLSLAVTRGTVLVEELPHALDDLADKIEGCRDLVDRATADV